jgi:hypothetical protein
VPSAARLIDRALGDLITNTAQHGRSRDRQDPPSTNRLILSGLSIVYAANAAGTPVAVWTSGEPSRKLHVIFAYEELRVRAFVSKRSSAGPANLDQANRFDGHGLCDTADPWINPLSILLDPVGPAPKTMPPNSAGHATGYELAFRKAIAKG